MTDPAGGEPVRDEPVRYEVVRGVAWLTIDRPDARNALSKAVREALFAGVRRFNADDEARVLVLTGAGDRAFCAGGDLKEMADEALTVPPPDFLPQFGRNIEVAKPTIAAVNGVAYAGGFLLAQNCDLCLAAESARFAVTEARVGRGSPWAVSLSWLVPPRIAMQILLTGEPISATRAYEIGLVNQVVPDADLVPAVQALALAGRGDDFPDQIAAEYRHLSAAGLLRWFRTARRALLEGYAAADPAARLPWYGLDMGPASSITARLMETWAHGQDIADTLGIHRPPTSRLRHIAHLGIRSLPYSYAVNGLPQPGAPVRIELVAPDGGQWAWGPADAGDRVSGNALDFCLVVTQRRHLSDTGLAVAGGTARQWIAIAQAFAGAAGPGRPPLGPAAAAGSRPGGGSP